MPTFQIADDVIPMSALRENLAGYVKQAQETKRPLLLTQNGRSAVVMMDATVFDSLREQLHKICWFPKGSCSAAKPSHPKSWNASWKPTSKTGLPRANARPANQRRTA